MAAPNLNTYDRIGELLLKEGLISQDQLSKALQEQKQNGTRLGYNLVKLGFIPELELTKALARQHKMPAVDLSRFELDQKIAKMIPADLAHKNLVLPLKRDGRTLTVAMADPSNLGVLEDLKFITRYDIFPVLAGEYTLRGMIEKTFGALEIPRTTYLARLDAALKRAADFAHLPTERPMSGADALAIIAAATPDRRR